MRQLEKSQPPCDTLTEKATPAEKATHRGRRVLALFLAATLALGGVPAPALAEAQDGLSATQETGGGTSGSDVQDQGDTSSNTQGGSQAEGGAPDATQDDGNGSGTGGSDTAGTDGTGGSGTQTPTVQDSGQGGSGNSQADADDAADVTATPTSNTRRKAPAAGDGNADDDSTAADAQDQTVRATVKVVGPDASGESVSWVSLSELTVPEGTTAEDLTRQALERNGMTCDTGMWTISALAGYTLPNGGQSLGYNPSTWDYWKFFVNGVSSNELASTYVVQDGDQISWLYGQWGSTFAAPDVEIDADATRPDYDSEWPGFKGQDQQGTSTAETPTTGAELAWQQALIDSSMMTFMSDAILVNGDVYVAAGQVLEIRDAATGRIKAQADLAARIESTCRLIYADGIVVVPLHGGRLQALTADTLTTVWLTDALPASATADGTELAQQPISTLTVNAGHVLFGTAAAGYDGSTAGGWLASVNLEDGSLAWTYQNTSAGYYWSGFAVTRAGVAVADDAGTVLVLDPTTGAIKAQAELGASSRSSVVASGDGSTIYVVTRDGVLHRLAVGGDGTLSQTGSLAFSAYSTSTPTLSGGRLYVGGRTSSGTGGLYVINALDLSLARQVVTLDSGEALEAEVKSAPLVVTRADGTYAYFTCNGPTGALYVYKLGDAAATQLYVPASAQQNYSLSSVVAASDGSLYYTNDSGYLFKLVASEDDDTDSGTDGGASDSGETDDDESGSGSGSSGRSGSRQQSGTGGALGRRLLRGRATLAAAREQGREPGGRGRDEGVPGSRDGGPGTRGDKAAPEAGEAAGVLAGEQAALLADGLPTWPIVGMCLGAAALLFALLWRRKNDDEEA